MPEWILVSLVLLGGFTTCFAVAYAMTRRGVEIASSYVPAEGAKFRLRSETGMHRTRLVGREGGGWRVAAPLNRDCYIPLRIGEMLTVETSERDCAIIFRTEILSRDPVDHTILLAIPTSVHRFDRRMGRREKGLGHGEIDGRPAEILDVSEHGAKVKVAASLQKGERIFIHLPWLEESVGAWILASEGLEARMCFEQPISLPVN